MKVLLTVIRIMVGALFIFSGLVKANDPLGLSYKMQEYFQVWEMTWLNDYALVFALVMNVFEIVAGIAVLLGWRMKIFSWLLLLLIVFFTFLTGYAAFSGKIAACGCFGDCIPLTPIQSFWKDVVLLFMIIFLLLNYRRVHAVLPGRIAAIVILASLVATALFQWFVLRHLPVVDCLPYKKGNNLVEQMKTPPGYIPDQYQYVFRYKKDGKLIEFPEDKLPADLDDSYEFVDREEKLVKKGNNLKAKISDFSLTTPDGKDVTQAILNQRGRYLMLFAPTLDKDHEERYNQREWMQLELNLPLIIVTADVEAFRKFTGNRFTILRCDGTVIKTAARANPTYLVMEGPVVLGKYSWADVHKLRELLNK